MQKQWVQKQWVQKQGRWISRAWLRWLMPLLMVGAPLTATLPGRAAERIYVSYSVFGRSLSVRELATFAREGTLSPELAVYARYLKPQQLAQLREGLQQKVDFPAIALSQFLYSPSGEVFLSRGSRLVQTPVGQGSFYALRAALILAASDPEGLTAISILRHYPNPGMVVNLQEVVGVVNDVNRVFRETDAITEAILAVSQGQSLPEAEASQLRQREQPGPLKWQKTTLDLEDRSAKRLQYTGKTRSFPIDLYLPEASQTPQPVVVISHGLNSDRQSYAYLAEHLASYGYGVIVPEHPGSNKKRLQSLFEGFGQDVSEPVEFLDRPLDIQFLLNAVQQLVNADPQLQDRLDLQNVGIIGQSYGGYTALAVAGASLNFGQMRQDCAQNLDTTLNMSLVLQCQALRLPDAPYKLADPRIKAAIAINPFTSSIFGAKSLAQIQVPTLIVTGSADVVAPAVAEQIQPFGALTTPQKYLALIQNSTHFSTIAPSRGEVASIADFQGVEGPSPDLARNYLKALSLTFLQRYLRNQLADQALLSPAGAATLSRAPLPLSIVTTLPAQVPPAPEVAP